MSGEGFRRDPGGHRRIYQRFIALETASGETVYINPAHVVSVMADPSGKGCSVQMLSAYHDVRIPAEEVVESLRWGE